MNYILSIVLVLLKVFDKIDWNWIWIFAPIWLVWIFPIFVILIGIVTSVVVSIIDAIQYKK